MPEDPCRTSTRSRTSTCSRTPALDPIEATDAGIAGHEHELTDYSPDGSDGACAARPRHARRARRERRRRPTRDRIAADVMRERLELADRAARRGRGAPRAPDHRQPGAGDPQLLRPHGLRHRRRLGARRPPHGTGRPTRSQASSRRSREGIARGLARGAPPGARLRAAGRDVGRRRRRPRRPSVLRRARRGTPQRAHARSTPRSTQAADDATAAYAAARRVPPRRVRAHGRPARSGRPRSLRAVRPRVQRHRPRSRRDLRLGLGRALPHRGARCATSRAGSCPANPWRRSPSTSTTTRSRTVEGVDAVPAVEPGAHRLDDRRAQRHALRHRAAVAPVRGDDLAAGRRGRDVLHGPERGLQPARSHVVPDAGQDDVSALARGEHLLPRGRTRPSPAGRAGEVPVGEAVTVPTRVRVHLRPRRRLGALRRTADGRARLPRRPRLRARHARRAGDARRARDRRHRHAPRAPDPRGRAIPPGRDVDAASSRCRS